MGGPVHGCVYCVGRPVPEIQAACCCEIKQPTKTTATAQLDYLSSESLL